MLGLIRQASIVDDQHFPNRFVSQYYAKVKRRVAYQLNRLQHSLYSPDVSLENISLVNALKREGACVTALDRFASLETDRLIDSSNEIMRVLADIEPINYSGDRSIASYYMSKKDILDRFPAVFTWGLQPSVLNIVETYLGVPASYRGVSLRRDALNHQQIGTRRWHIDGEDYRVVKLIVYLNDVNLESGPFEYIPRKFSPSYKSFKGIERQILDADMQRIVSHDQWVPCPGPKGTVVICDTASVFHHGSVPKSERVALIYTYFSRCAKNPNLGVPQASSLSQDVLLGLKSCLSQRQMACLWENNHG